MWNNTRRGFNLIRGRNNSRRNKTYSKMPIITLGITFGVFIIGGIFIWKIKTNPENFAGSNNVEDNIIEVGQGNVNVYSEVADSDNLVDINKGDSSNVDTNVDLDNKEDTVVEEQKDKTFTFTVLGEMMMGGMEDSYLLAYKDISEEASKSDYTLTSLATNIVDVDKIEDSKSKYVVTKDISKAFTILGIDGINVATDHMMDFSQNIFKETKSQIEKAELDIIGLEGDIIYAEKDGIKVAFIGVCNEVIGSYSNYIKAGIWMYDDYMTKIKAGIQKAKDNADTVVVVTHLGSENSHEVTSVMSWFYHELVNAGADLVLGNHALGVYPIEIYKDTPIIYSLGYLMHDTTYDIGKKSGIFNFTVDVNGKVKTLEIIPTYIVEDEVKLYMEYDLKEATEFLEYISSTKEKYNYDTKIDNDSLKIVF